MSCTSWKYSSVHGLLEPALMSPRCTTRSTLGSAFICAIKSGSSASLAAPYGVSPMTATVYGSRDPMLIGCPVVCDGAAPLGDTGVSLAHPARVTHVAREATSGSTVPFIGSSAGWGESV